MNQRKVRCGFCGKLQTIDEIRLCSTKAHTPKAEGKTKVEKASEPARAEVKSFCSKEERDAWIAENPGARALSTNVRRVSAWNQEQERYVTTIVETFKAVRS